MIGCSTLKHIRPPVRLLAMLLMLAVLLRALIPTGYMPNTDKVGNGPALTMCVVGLTGPTVIYLDLGLDGSHDPHIDHPLLDCVFGAALSFLGLNTNTPTLVLGLLLLPLILRRNSPSVLRRCHFLGAPLGARGPPVKS